MIKQYKIYSDESGYTGDDLSHATQSFFVYSFLMFDSKAEEQAAISLPQIVNSIFKKDPPDEIKFLKLRKNTKGKRAVSEICKFMSQMGVQAHFSILEKRFQICAMVVETFFDPKYNTQSPPEAGAEIWRQKVANFIYESCTDQQLRDFLEAAKEDDVAAIKKAGAAFAFRLRLHPNEHASRAGHALDSGLSNFYRFGIRVDGTPKGAERPSSSVVAFIPALAHIDKFLTQKNATAEIICDVTKEYGPVLDWALKQAQDPIFVSEVSSEFGYEKAIDRISGRTEILESGDNAGIQCADIVAGLINHRALERKHQRPVDPMLQQAWLNLKPCIDATRTTHFKMMATKLGKIP